MASLLQFFSQSPPSSATETASDSNGASCSAFLSTIRANVKISPHMVAHVAVVAALVCAVFVTILNMNFIALIFVGIGVIGEGYLVFQIWKHYKASQPEQPQERKDTVKTE